MNAQRQVLPGLFAEAARVRTVGGGDSPANQEGAVPSHRTAGRPAADVQSCSWHHMTCCFQKPKNRSVSSGRRSLDSAVLLVPRHLPPSRWSTLGLEALGVLMRDTAQPSVGTGLC